MSPRWFLTLILLGLMIAPTSAIGGGWATVGLSSTPEGTTPGEPWRVEIEVLQHGQTPLEGVVPKVRIRQRGGDAQTFAARPTTRPGVYLANVDFPNAGTWSYEVDDGFSQRHSFPAVRIGGTAAAATGSGANDGDDPPWAALGGAIVAGLAAAGLTLAVQRRRERSASEQQGAMPAGG